MFPKGLDELAGISDPVHRIGKGGEIFWWICITNQIRFLNFAAAGVYVLYD